MGSAMQFIKLLTCVLQMQLCVSAAQLVAVNAICTF